MLYRSWNLLSACLPLPDVEGLSPNCAIRICGQQVAAWMEVAMDECVSGEKVLGLPRRFESLHLAFSTSCRPMGVFRAIVQISTLSVFNLREQLAPRHAIA